MVCIKVSCQFFVPAGFLLYLVASSSLLQQAGVCWRLVDATDDERTFLRCNFHRDAFYSFCARVRALDILVLESMSHQDHCASSSSLCRIVPVSEFGRVSCPLWLFVGCYQLGLCDARYVYLSFVQEVSQLIHVLIYPVCIPLHDFQLLLGILGRGLMHLRFLGKLLQLFEHLQAFVTFPLCLLCLFLSSSSAAGTLEVVVLVA